MVITGHVKAYEKDYPKMGVKATSPGVLSKKIGEYTASRPVKAERMHSVKTAKNHKFRHAVEAAKAHDPGPYPDKAKVKTGPGYDDSKGYTKIKG